MEAMGISDISIKYALIPIRYIPQGHRITKKIQENEQIIYGESRECFCHR